jgi:RsiW-degrading membrane proteinase PrsW (M82 family)
MIPFFWGIIWAVFKLTAIGLAALLIPVSPNKNFSLYSLGILILINCIALIIYYWSRNVDYSWRVIIMSLIITVFVLDFSTSILIVFSKRGDRSLNTTDAD